jgi:hypothetical protein
MVETCNHDVERMDGWTARFILLRPPRVVKKRERKKRRCCSNDMHSLRNAPV